MTEHTERQSGARGLAGTAYDTAWVASVPSPEDPSQPRFPRALQWVLENQLSDGSWGGVVRYEHDRIVSTLAALTALATFPRIEHTRPIEMGTRYLWQHSHLLRAETMETVGFELLLPALVKRAETAGIAVPPFLSELYQVQREEKLRLIPPAFLYSPRTTAVHSLEFLGEEVDREALRAAQGRNGAIGNSPAATAFFLIHHGDDARAAAYVRECLAANGGATVPVLHPCETYELLWSAYHLFLGGVPARDLLSEEQREYLRSSIDSGGVSLSPTFHIPDADDTAVALLLLHSAGESVDPGVLADFELSSGYFASFPHERHSSVGVNLHVLHALLEVPGYQERDTIVERILGYLEEQMVDGLYWLDKWHISPLYATAHAVRILATATDGPFSERAAALAERAREWVRRIQNADGSWGFYGEATVEETAYGVLALSDGIDADAARCAAAVRYLETWQASQSAFSGLDEASLPPLWIDKCLYTPVQVVRSVIDAALLAARSSLSLTSGTARDSRTPVPLWDSQPAARRRNTLGGAHTIHA